MLSIDKDNEKFTILCNLLHILYYKGFFIMLKKYILPSLLLLSFAKPSFAMLAQPDTSLGKVIAQHPAATLLIATGAAATAYYIYNPLNTKRLVRNAVNTSAVANSITVGGAIGTAAGLFSNYMARRQMDYSTCLPLIAGITVYQTATTFMQKNNIPHNESISYLAALSTWYKPDWFNK